MKWIEKKTTFNQKEDCKDQYNNVCDSYRKGSVCCNNKKP